MRVSTSSLKNRTKTINYEKNLRKLLGWEDWETKVLRKSSGILKGKLKISPVAWQRKIRKEWDARLKRQYKIGAQKLV